MKRKVSHVLRAGQTRDHECHWPGCEEQVPPAMWGCREHWRRLPHYLRRQLWMAYEIGQEERGDPSPNYLRIAQEIQDWAKSWIARRER